MLEEAWAVGFFVDIFLFFCTSVMEKIPGCLMLFHVHVPPHWHVLACEDQPGPVGSSRSSISGDSDPFSRRSKGRPKKLVGLFGHTHMC